MKKPVLVSLLLGVGLGSLGASIPGCKSSGSSGGDDAGGAHSASSSGGDGAGGVVNSTGGRDSPGTSEAGAPGNAGSPGSEAGSPGHGDAGGPNTGSADALPTTTFLYVRSTTPDTDELVALDYMTGKERVVTDLRSDDHDGWEIWGHAISPDRRRIVLASLYGPTKADNDTGLPTRRIWTLATDGSDFQRLTPVFENDGGGKSGYNISVQDPAFTADGSGVIYDFGNWWYEGTSMKGGSLPWLVSTQGDLPEFFPTVSSCSVIDPSVNPATGDLLFIHSVCVNAADAGIFLYPSSGGSQPVKLVGRSFGSGGVDPRLEKASWLADGSAFIFVGTIEVTRGAATDTVGAILAFDMQSGDISVVLEPEAGTDVRNAAIAPNGDGIIYCLAHDDVYDLHAIDLTVSPPVDAVITDDGISCSPVF